MTSSNSGDPKFTVTTVIAFFLLLTYTVLLIILMVNYFNCNCIKIETEPITYDCSRCDQMFDLFKSGLILLGGSVTTVVGYYFGSETAGKAYKLGKSHA